MKTVYALEQFPIILIGKLVLALCFVALLIRKVADAFRGTLSGSALAIAVLLTFSAPVRAADITFWDTPQYGGNSFNGTPPDAAYFRALRATGATWVRLTFSKWKGAGRDFLIGDADHYTGIPPSDMATLVKVLDAA